jgi:hypothetical protein
MTDNDASPMIIYLNIKCNKNVTGSSGMDSAFNTNLNFQNRICKYFISKKNCYVLVKNCVPGKIPEILLNI